MGTLSIFKNKDVLGDNKKKAKKINALFENHKNLPIHNFRNLGMIWAFELDNQVDIEKVIQSFLKQGVFIRPINRTFYFMPPYSINSAEMSHMIKVSEQSIKSNV